jgi:hypothetical protein
MKQQLSFWKEDSTQAASRPTAQAYQKSPRKPLTINELPEGERPVNRLHHYGANALSTTELLAILLGNPHQLQDASALLATFETLVGVAQAPVAELQCQPGVGLTTAARLKAHGNDGKGGVSFQPGGGHLFFTGRLLLGDEFLDRQLNGIHSDFPLPVIWGMGDVLHEQNKDINTQDCNVNCKDKGNLLPCSCLWVIGTCRPDEHASATRGR